LYAGLGWMDAKLAKRSMELFAREVLSRLNTPIKN
jgi:hypothetical protein